MKLVELALCAAVATWAFTPGDGAMETTLALYDNSSCSAPPYTMTITRELGCIPQKNHWDPVCDSSGTAHYVKDCTRYYPGGSDDYGLISDAFGWDVPYLLVEEYDRELGEWGSKCSSESLINATAYVLDERCHTNAAGTMSTKLTIGHSVIITTYEDPDCEAAVHTTEVTQSSVAYRQCIDGAKRFYLGGPEFTMTAVAVFEDSSCSETPVGVKFTRDFVCGASRDSDNTVCGPDGAALYSISSCTRDYSGLSSIVFGTNTPYIVVEEYSDSWCSQVESVTVYIADGACHYNTDDATSFKVTLTTEAAATIITYTDTYCNAVQDKIVVDKQNLTSYTCARDEYCSSSSGYGCSKRVSVGGLGGESSMGRMSSYAVYDNASCSEPAQTVTLTRELGCTPQKNHWDPVCDSSGTAHYVKDCMRYYPGGSDDYGLISDAFGWDVPYLLVEEYDRELGEWGSKCSSESLINATAYVLDERCHTNAAGTMSTKLTIGHSVIITTYEDPDCEAAVHTTEVTQSSVAYRQCIDGAKRFYLGGPEFTMTAVAVFEDSSCSETPVGVKFTRDFVCGASRDSDNTVCGPDGAALYSISSCTRDYSGLSSIVFGTNTPYIVVEEYSDSWCSQVESVTVYIADGACHYNTDDATSFKVTLTTEAAATIITYTDTYCNAVQDKIVVDKQNLTSYTCARDEYCSSSSGYGCSKRISVGGLGSAVSFSPKKATLVYDVKGCKAVAVEFTVQPVRSCLASTTVACKKLDFLSSALYQASNCVEDVAEFAASHFGNVPYLIVENYAADTNCQTLKTAVVYKADGRCYPRVSDGTYFKITPSFGASLTIATYPDASCSDFDVEYVTVGTKFINTGRCFKGVQRFYANMSALFAPSPPPMVDVESLTREQIMFPEWLWEPTPRRVFQSD